MANLLQDQFSSVFSNPSNDQKKDPTFEAASCSIIDSIIVTPSIICKAIDEMSMVCAAGEDGVPSILLKTCKVDVYGKNLLKIHLNPENYRLISLTINLIKISGHNWLDI